MTDLLADIGSIQGTASNIDEASSQAQTLANQVLHIAEGTVWGGGASKAFVEAVNHFRDQKDTLTQLLSQIGGDVDQSAVVHESNEQDQITGMNNVAATIA